MSEGTRNLTANFTASSSGFSAGIAEIKQKLNELNTALAQNKQSIKETNSAITENRKEYKQLQSEIQQNGTATSEQQRKLQQLGDEYAQLTADLGVLTTAQSELRTQIRQTNAQMDEQVNHAKAQKDALNDVKSAAGDTGKYLAGLGAAATAAFTSVLALTSKYALAADDINTLAKTTGLSTEAIQKYQYATDLCDVSIENIADSIKQLVPKMQQAQAGSTDLQQTFKTLGVEYQNADGSLRDSSEVFEDVLSGLGKIQNQTERTATAVKLFGENASKLNPIIADGGESFRAVSKQMERYILPQETLDRLNAFNDKLDALKARGTGVLSQIAAELSGGFDPLFDTANGLLDRVQEAIDNGEIKELATEVAGVINDVADALGKATRFAIDFRDEIGAGATALVTFQTALKVGTLIEKTATAVKSLTSATKAQTAAQEANNVAMAANPVGLVAAALATATGAALAFNNMLDDCNEKTQSMMSSVGQLIDKSEEYRSKSEKLNDIAERYEEITRSQEGTEEGMDELRRLQDELVQNFGSEADGIDFVTAAFSDQDNVLGQLLDKRREYNQISEDYAREALEQLDRAEQNNTAVKTGNMFSGEKGGIGQDSIKNWVAQNLKTFDLGPTAGADAAGFGLNTIIPGLGAVDDIFLGDTFYLKGTFEERADDLEKLYNYLVVERGMLSTDSTVQEVKQLQAQMRENAENRDKYRQMLNNTAPDKDNDDNSDGNHGDTAGPAESDNSSIVEDIRKQREAEYADKKKALKRSYDRGEINEDAYLAQLLQLAENYNGWGSDAYEDTLTSQIQYEKRAAENRTSEQQKAYDEEYKAKKQSITNQHDFELISDGDYYKRAYQLAVEYYGKQSQTAIDAEKQLYKWRKQQAESFRKEQLEGTKSAYDELFAAIDAETEKRNRKKEDDDLAERERILNNRLAYEQLDEFSRAELEKELASLQEEKNDLLYDRSVEDAKAAAEEIYELAQKAYEDASVDLNAAMTQATTIFSALGQGTRDIATAITNNTNTTNNNQAVTVQVDAFNKTLDQLVDAFKKAISSDL